MSKYASIWIVIILLTLMIFGCTSQPKPTPPSERKPTPPEAIRPEESAAYWYKKTAKEQTASGNFSIIKTLPQTERWPGEDIRWLLRSYKGKNAEVAHQLYINVRYKGEWRTYTQASFDHKGTRQVKNLAKGTGSCEHGCINKEAFTIDLTTEELTSLSVKKEIQLKLDTRFPNLSTLILIPGAYLQGHLLKYKEAL